MKKSVFMCILAFMLVALPCAAEAVKNGAFIMSPQSTNAYFYDGTYVTGVSLVSDTGEKGCPYISSFGNVYVSLESVYDVIGSDDDTEYYVHNKADNTITIKINGKKTVVPVGKKFIVRDDKKSEGMFVYEIGESLYVPARLIAMMCGGAVTYNDKTEDIVLFTESDIQQRVVNGDGSIRDDFKGMLGDSQAMNNLLKNNKYLMPDLKTIGTIAEADSVFRVGTDVYYISDYKLYSAVNGAEAKQLLLKGAAGEAISVYICSAVAAGGRIYGIAAPQPAGKSGRVFMCEYDGTNFRYVNSLAVSGLIKQSVDKADYLYYMSAGRESHIYMYDVAGNDEYKLIIQDKNGKSAVGSAERFGIMNNGIFTVAADKKSVTLLRFERPPYECEWIKIRSDKKIRKIDGYSDGEGFSNLECINYDSKTGFIYAVDKKDGICRLIGISAYNSGVSVIKEYTDVIVNICLFEENGVVKVYVEGSDDTIDVIAALT